MQQIGQFEKAPHAVRVDLIDAIQAIKKMEVREDVGEKVSIALPIVASDDDPIYFNTSVRRWIKSGKYL